MKISTTLHAITPIALTCIALANPVTWDGEAGDGLWTSPQNWSVDRLPRLGDDVVIKDAEVIWDNTLENGNLLAESLRLDGKTHLKVAAVIRFNHAQIHIGSKAKLTSEQEHQMFLDWLGGQVTFESGAELGGKVLWENKLQPSFTFKLDAQGFKPLRPYIFSVDAPPENAATRYVVDLKDYRGPSQKLVLVQFDRCSKDTYPEWFSTKSTEILNAGVYQDCRFEWEKETHSLVLHIEKNHSARDAQDGTTLIKMGNLTLNQHRTNSSQ
ncbi:hypothetical protein [Rubritalea marina]|uniref:hypothetical protein n=1 Tax=Rubritalea marina TaxID=361055 RepID=UPI0003A34ABE|nr:hypothetical protein [Rubritalea marina]